MAGKSTDPLIDLEMAFSRQPHMDDTCGDLYALDVVCRRMRGHDGEHAHGWGSGRTYWGVA